MAVNIQCPQCRLLLQLPEAMLGKKVKCSACQAVFTANPEGSPAEIMAAGGAAPSAAPPPPPDRTDPRGTDSPRDDRARDARDDDDRPRRPRRQEDDADRIDRDGPPPSFTADEKATWGVVASGFFLQARAQYVYAGAMFLWLITFFVTAANEFGGPGFGGVFFGGLSVLALLGSLVVSVLAASHFLSAGSAHGARPFALTLLILAAIGMFRVSGMLLDTMGMNGNPDRPGWLMAFGFLAFLLVEMARLTILPFFIRAVALNMKVSGLATHAFAQTIATPAAFAFVLLLFLLIGLARSPGMAVAIMVLSALIYIGLLVWSALLCHFAGRAVTDRCAS